MPTQGVSLKHRLICKVNVSLFWFQCYLSETRFLMKDQQAFFFNTMHELSGWLFRIILKKLFKLLGPCRITLDHSNMEQGLRGLQSTRLPHAMRRGVVTSLRVWCKLSETKNDNLWVHDVFLNTWSILNLNNSMMLLVLIKWGKHLCVGYFPVEAIM